MHHLLIVEDDKDIADLIRLNCQEITTLIDCVEDGESALTQLKEKHYHLVILDLMLPGISGLDVCRELRYSKPEQAILMLTSKTSETDRVLGLELGADDYMTKPFSVRELQARIRAQLRKVDLLEKAGQAPQASDILCVGKLVIDQTCHRVMLNNKALDLTSTEFDLICHFAQYPNRVFTRTQLLDSVWGYQHSGYEHTVNSHINRLRNKIELNPNQPEIIQTVWGVGYKFNPEGVSF